MDIRKGFLRYDTFKLVVFILLLILLVYLELSIFPGKFNAPSKGREQTAADLRSLETEDVLIPERVNFPDLPASNRELVLNGSQDGLIDENGSLVFMLSDNGEQWVPVVDDLLRLSLPSGFTTREDESGIWFIIAPDGSVLYIFSEEDAIWKLQEKPISAGLPSAVMQDPGFSCPLANPVRIAGDGEQVRVVNALIPLRITPDAVSQNFVLELDKNTVLEVVGSPVCQPYLSGANVWWRVRLLNGIEGYAAEGSAISTTYYLEPVQ